MISLSSLQYVPVTIFFLSCHDLHGHDLFYDHAMTFRVISLLSYSSRPAWRCWHQSHSVIMTSLNFDGKNARDVDPTYRFHLQYYAWCIFCSILYGGVGLLVLFCFLSSDNLCLPRHRGDEFSLITIRPMGVGVGGLKL